MQSPTTSRSPRSFHSPLNLNRNLPVETCKCPGFKKFESIEYSTSPNQRLNVSEAIHQQPLPRVRLATSVRMAILRGLLQAPLAVATAHLIPNGQDQILLLEGGRLKSHVLPYGRVRAEKLQVAYDGVNSGGLLSHMGK